MIMLTKKFLIIEIFTFIFTATGHCCHVLNMNKKESYDKLQVNKVMQL